MTGGGTRMKGTESSMDKNRSTMRIVTVIQQRKQCRSAQCSAVQYNTVGCSAVQYNLVQCSAAQCSAYQRSTV